LTQTDLHAEFDRLARELAVLPEETLVLGVRDGTDVVYIGRRIGSRPVGVSYQVGLRMPAHCTASGKALLSCLPPDTVRELYDPGLSLEALTPQTITNISDLLEDLRIVETRGYAVDDEETAPGMMCVGTPVRDQAGRGVGAVAVSMVKAATTNDRLSVVAGEMRRLADNISTALGATSLR